MDGDKNEHALGGLRGGREVCRRALRRQDVHAGARASTRSTAATYYASQTFNDIRPTGGEIQIGWGRIDMPGMPFNQMMTFPCELTLRTTPEGIRMFARPVKEIETLHARSHVRQDVALTADKPLSVAVAGDLFDIRAEFHIGPAKAWA